MAGGDCEQRRRRAREMFALYDKAGLGVISKATLVRCLGSKCGAKIEINRAADEQWLTDLLSDQGVVLRQSISKSGVTQMRRSLWI